MFFRGAIMAVVFFFGGVPYFYVVALQRITGVNLAAAAATVKIYLQIPDFFAYLCRRISIQIVMSKTPNPELVKTILKVVIYVATAILSFLGGTAIN